MLSLYSVGAVLVFTIGAKASCECGYKTNTGDVWQYAVTTDFSSVSNTQFQSSSDWEIVDATHAAGTSNPYTLDYVTGNVNVKNSALQLTCSGYNSSSSSKTIYGAEISTNRDDILYGSFRSKHKFLGSSGAVGALFFYANDSQETDIELLTRDPVKGVHFTNQPDETEYVYLPNGKDRTSYQEYRFDWTPAATRFYINDVSSGNITTEVPSTNGSIKMNSWANGGSFAGTTVPSNDSILYVQTISLYFNTSSTSSNTTWHSTCSSAKTKVCSVDSAKISYNTTSTTSSSSKSNSASSNSNSNSGKSSSSSSSSSGGFSSSNSNNKVNNAVHKVGKAFQG